MTFQRPSNIEIVKFENVKLSYSPGISVFHNLDFSFLKGSFYFLTGPSGSGKTSLLRIIYRDLIPTSGIVRVFGHNISTVKASNLPHFRQRMGLVFQDCRLLNHLNATDNVVLALKISGMEIKKSYNYAKELLHWVGLGNHLQSLPNTLSDGQKQRVAIARAVITRPLLLLADEPTGNVDEETAYKLMLLFEELNKLGTTVILATHNKNLTSSFSYPELYIQQGVIKFNQLNTTFNTAS